MNKNLKKIVEYAYNNVPFYRSKIDRGCNDIFTISSMDEFKRLPLVNKSIYYDKKQPILSDEFESITNDVIICHTSGTTGQSVSAYWNKADFSKSMFELWLERRKHGITTYDKSCKFFTNLYQGNTIIKNAKEKKLTDDKLQLFFSKMNLTEERLEIIYNDMLDFEPRWLSLQPSTAQLLLELKKKRKLPVIESIKYIELMGEHYLDSFKKELQVAFSCPVRNMYGMVEINGIAYEKEDGKLEILKSNVYVEIIKDEKEVDNGESGEICVTCYNNHMMPLIRYLTGDIGRIEEGALILEKGRKNEFILTSNGEKISIYVLLTPIEKINEQFNDIILDVRFIQKDCNSFLVNFIVKPEYMSWKQTIIESFMENMTERRLANAQWDFAISDKVSNDYDGGKRKFFKSEIKNQEGI